MLIPLQLLLEAYAVTVGTGADNSNNVPRAPQPNGGDSSIVLPVGTVTGKGGGTPGDYNPGNSFPMPSNGGSGGNGGGGGTIAPAYPPDAPYPAPWSNPHPATQPSQPTYGGVVTNYGNAGGQGGPNSGSPPNNNFLSGGGGGGAGAAGESAGPGSGPGHAGRGGDGQPFPQFAYPLVFPGPDASSLGPYSPTTSHYGGGGGGGGSQSRWWCHRSAIWKWRKRWIWWWWKRSEWTRKILQEIQMLPCLG